MVDQYLCRLHGGGAVGVLHLTAVNPYIAGSLEQQQEQGSSTAVWMPRGHSAAPSAASASGSDSWQGAVGISGLAFQGTNAHVVLARCVGALVRAIWKLLLGLKAEVCHLWCCACPCRPHDLAVPPSAAASMSHWDRRRHWYAPAAHRLLLQHTAAAGSSRVECSLAHAQHAYLWQHTVSGRSILPGAAMFEAAFAAAAALLPKELQQLRLLGLQSAAIAAPLLLKPLTGKGSHALLVVTVQQRSGAVQLSSRDAAAGKQSRPVVHLAGTAGCVPATAASLPQPLVTPTAAPLLTLLPNRLVSAPSWQGQALGSICQQPLLPASDSYHCHPAAVDAATHFGAVFDLSQSAAPRVPVSLGCYSAGSASESSTAD